MRKMEEYPFVVQPLSDDDDGGWLVTFPDLPGCMADGESVEEAIHEAKDAFEAWIEGWDAMGRTIPEPGSGGASGKFVLRTPKSLHAKLAARARQEGVSMNMLAVSILAESMGKVDSR